MSALVDDLLISQNVTINNFLQNTGVLMKLATRFISVLLLIVASSSIYAAVPAKEMVCRTCHGEGGAKTLIPSYPKLNGQNKDYLVQVLKAYKKGERKAGMAAVMAAQAAMLSDAEIVELAEYYSSQP
ncbi:MAG: cytochrome c [Candidatus Azotimanducaceae bacterium]|jgi:cytochrome c